MQDFIDEQGLQGVSTAGQSMGARIVLELARRGVGGDTVALDPGGFWSDRELRVFGATLRPSIALVRVLRGALPFLLGNPVGRTLLLAQLSARPWALSRDTVLPRRPRAGRLALGARGARRPDQGTHAGGQRRPAPSPVASRSGGVADDLVTLPRQAPRALELFPDATLHWFEKCGHFPQWDAPDEAARLILARTD